MRAEKAPDLLHQVRTDGARAVRDWLAQVWAGKVSVPAGFPWHGLAEVAASKAQEADDLAWGEIAAAVYDRLASDAGEAHGEGFATSAMHLRAWMIARHGPRPGHPVLNLDRVLNWIRDSLVMPPEETVARGAAWRGADLQEQQQRVAEARLLRRIKNRLAVLGEVVATDAVAPSADLAAWLAVRDELP